MTAVLASWFTLRYPSEYNFAADWQFLRGGSATRAATPPPHAAIDSFAAVSLLLCQSSCSLLLPRMAVGLAAPFQSRHGRSGGDASTATRRTLALSMSVPPSLNF